MQIGSVSSQVISPVYLSRQDKEAWQEFLAPQPLAFLSYPFACVVHSCLPHVRICRISQNNQIVAFFPFQYRSRAHAVAGIGERLGGELSDYFGIVAKQGFRIDAKTLLRLSGLHSLLFSQLDESQQENGLIGEKPEIGFRINLPEGGQVYWREKKKSDRKFVIDTDRREQKIIREFGPLSFAFSEGNAKMLDDLIVKKRAQYQRTNVPDVLRSDRAQAILRALYRTRDDQCAGIVSTLHAGETWVASHFGLLSGSTLHYWFPVYNPALKMLSPGRILLKQIILAAQTYGIACIDRGGGDSAAKRDFATSQHYFYSGLWQRHSVRAISHHIGLSMSWRMAQYVKLCRARLS